MAVPSTSSVADQTVTLALRRMSELFYAPEINPFSDRPVDLRGESGITYLHHRVRLRWLRSYRATRLTIQLPQQELPATDAAATQRAQATQSALHRYCRAQITHNDQVRRRERGVLWRQLLIVLPVSALAFVLLLALVTGQLMPEYPYLQGVLIIVTLFVGSIALWDVLSGLLFGWVPYEIDNRAYRLLADLEVRIEAEPGVDW